MDVVEEVAIRIALISPYPAPDSKRPGMAWYAENLVKNLPSDTTVTVLADRSDKLPRDYSDGPIRVSRCWSYGPTFIIGVMSELKRQKPDVVHIQHEVFLYGSFLWAIMFPFLVLSIRLMGLPVVVTVHNGILPLSKVDRLFLQENGIDGPPMALKGGLKVLLWSVVNLSTASIVHEENLKELLVQEYGCPREKLYVVHHGIETSHPTVSHEEAKAELGLSGRKVALFLGYLAGYKNVELLIDAAKISDIEGLVVLIGGGKHPRLAKEPKYLEYSRSLEKRAAGAPPDRIRFVGFIPEDRVPLYVAAADLLVFPYKNCMSASGPLTIALSYGRPVLVSTAFRDLVDLPNSMFDLDPIKLAQSMRTELEGPGAGRTITYEGLSDRQWPRVGESTRAVYLAAQAQR